MKGQKGQDKKEELKHFSQEDKKVRDIKGGDNASMSDEDWDYYEKQQAGGTHKGGLVHGARSGEASEVRPDKGM